jgi:hypothetical protein
MYNEEYYYSYLSVKELFKELVRRSWSAGLWVARVVLRFTRFDSCAFA